MRRGWIGRDHEKLWSAGLQNAEKSEVDGAAHPGSAPALREAPGAWIDGVFLMSDERPILLRFTSRPCAVDRLSRCACMGGLSKPAWMPITVEITPQPCVSGNRWPSRDMPSHNTTSACSMPMARAYQKTMSKRGSGTRKPPLKDTRDGQVNLGSLYDYGRGVPQDFKMAVRWYRRSADQGNDLAEQKTWPPV